MIWSFPTLAMNSIALSWLTENYSCRRRVVPIPEPYLAFIVTAILLPDTYISKLGGDKAEQVLYVLRLLLETQIKVCGELS